MEQDKSLKKYTLIVVTAVSFLMPFMGSAINLSIPSIGKEFNSNAFLLSWVVTSYLLASAAFLVPFGRLADIVGRKKILILGTAWFSLSSLFCGVAWSIKVLIAFRVLQGIGGAMIFGTGMAILTSVFPPQERGKVLGINVATVYTGLSMGPVLGGAMNQHWGWKSIFYFVVFMGVPIVLLTVLKLKGEWAGASEEKFDFIGAALYTAGLTTFMLGISSITEAIWSKYLLVFGLLIITTFVSYEMKAHHPILNLRIFRKNTAFIFSNLAAFINYSATAAVGFLLSLHLQVVMGYNSQLAGLILLSQPLIMALLSPFAGMLSDRIEPRFVSSWGMGLTTLGLFVFCFIAANTPIWLIISTLVMLGTGFALFSSPNTNAVMGSVEKKFYGLASSILGTMRLTGQAISMAVVTLLIALFIGNVKLSPENADMLIKSTRIAFIIFAFTCLGGIFASLARGNIAQPSKHRIANE